ncbi:MAG: YetF domain-containing protein [Devosia sp.]
MDQAISILDWQRMLFGNEPPLYLLEIVVRTVIIYVYALALLRWLGSRTIGQLSTVEFLLVIALGSAVGDAMFYPDVPLLHALLVVTVVVVANKLLDLLIARFKRAERMIDGMPEEAIRDGVFCKPFLTSTSMGVSEIFQELRERGIEHLGQIAHAYVEADGGVAIYCRKDDNKPGLPIVPPWDINHPLEFRAGDRPASAGPLACMHCGTVATVRPNANPGRCANCDHDRWTPAQTGTLYAEAAPG